MPFRYSSFDFIGCSWAIEGKITQSKASHLLYIANIQSFNSILKLGEEKPTPYKDSTTEAEKQLHAQLVTSSWCGLLAALTPLIDAATDESITENVLKAMQNYAALCGTLDIQTPRDAFITAICRSSLPPHYALSVLNMGYQFSGIISMSISRSILFFKLSLKNVPYSCV